jgi:hemoglobin
MSDRPTPYTPPGGPPAVAIPSPEIFTSMGADGFYRMLEDFYRALSASDIRNMFPSTEEGLINSSRRSAAFFIQICGGPPAYSEQFGPPRLRARHLPFAIGEMEKTVWLSCFMDILEDAPEKYQFPETHLPGFKAWLTAFASWMVNRKPDTTP